MMANDQTEPVHEQDPRFPSGRWKGHYLQMGHKSPQEFILHFAEGNVSGMGADPVGMFVVTGHYALDSGRVFLRKQYPGAHRVEYDGNAEVQHGIWGLWQIPGDDRGGFQIRPDGEGASGPGREEEEERPVDAGVSELVGTGAGQAD